MKKDTCCFTGHRKIKAENEETIRAKLREQILALLDLGFTSFLVGGAMGFDMLVAEVLLDLRKNGRNELRIVSVLPFPEWRAKWPQEESEREDLILEKSDEVMFTTDKDDRKSYLARDRDMVNRSSYCIAYCCRKSGGTAYTIRYALSQGITVHNLADWDISQLLNTAEEKPLVFR